MTDREIVNAKKREYFHSHPEAREKRNAYTRKWLKDNREHWNAYMREYLYKKRMAKAVLKYQTKKENVV